MQIFRLSRDKYAIPLSGIGAAVKGGRWNSPGVELIYTASNRSLAMAEVAVHFTLATLPNDYVMLTIDIPNDIAIKKLDAKDLSSEWKNFPYSKSTRTVGDQFVFEMEYLALMIPSVVTQGDYNILINPHHPEFKKVSVVQKEKFPFDYRIFK